MTNITLEARAAVLQRFYIGEEKVADIAASAGVSRQTIYNWAKGCPRKRHPKAIRIQTSSKELWRLRNHAAFQERVNRILRVANLPANATLHEKLKVMSRLHAEDKAAYPVNSLCAALNVSRGAFYGYTRYGKNENAWFRVHRRELEVAIRNVFDESEQRYGADKITFVLKKRGHHTCRATVKCIMRDLGLVSIREGAKRQWKLEHRKPRDLVQRKFSPDRPNQIWVSDVSEFNFKRTKYYICVVIDLFSRKVVAHRTGLRNSTHLVKMTFRDAWRSRNAAAGLVYHSDRGANFRSYSMGSTLRELGIQESFSRAHVPYDNSVNEAFFKNLKTEELYRRRYRSVREFLHSIDTYIVFYNDVRLHQAIGFKTPSEAEMNFFDTTGVSCARQF